MDDDLRAAELSFRSELSPATADAYIAALTRAGRVSQETVNLARFTFATFLAATKAGAQHEDEWKVGVARALAGMAVSVRVPQSADEGPHTVRYEPSPSGPPNPTHI